MRRKLYDVLSGEDGSRASFAYACAMVAFIVASLVPFLILAFMVLSKKFVAADNA